MQTVPRKSRRIALIWRSMASILGSTFVLSVQDLDRSVRFYFEQLGVTEDLRVPGWAFVSRGAAKLRLGHCSDSLPMSQVPDHSWFAYLHVDDARALHAELSAKRVGLWHPLADQPWGMREFAILTPDGHRIVFGQRL